MIQHQKGQLTKHKLALNNVCIWGQERGRFWQLCQINRQFEKVYLAFQHDQNFGLGPASLQRAYCSIPASHHDPINFNFTQENKGFFPNWNRAWCKTKLTLFHDLQFSPSYIIYMLWQIYWLVIVKRPGLHFNVFFHFSIKTYLFCISLYEMERKQGLKYL